MWVFAALLSTYTMRSAALARTHTHIFLSANAPNQIKMCNTGDSLCKHPRSNSIVCAHRRPHFIRRLPYWTHFYPYSTLSVHRLCSSVVSNRQFSSGKTSISTHTRSQFSRCQRIHSNSEEASAQRVSFFTFIRRSFDVQHESTFCRCNGLKTDLKSSTKLSRWPTALQLASQFFSHSRHQFPHIFAGKFELFLCRSWHSIRWIRNQFYHRHISIIVFWVRHLLRAFKDL